MRLGRKRDCDVRLWRWLMGVAVVLVSVVPSGCDSDGNPFVMSLEPFYLATDVEADSRLAGSWRDKDGEVAFEFEPSGEKGKESEYKLSVKEIGADKELPGEFDACLVRLGGFRFLDLYPKSGKEGNEFYRAHFIRAHTLARVEIRQDSIQMAFFSAAWLTAKIKEKSVETPYTKADDALILTGKTAELQELAFCHANDDEAFADPLLLQRQPVEEEER
jgi:hypothetical protein